MKDAKPESEIVPLDSLPARQFEVTDDNSANWVVRKIVEAEHYARRVKEWAEREIKCSQVEATFFRQRFGPQLEAWARQQLAHARRKCVKLPAGTVGFRTEPAKLDVTDEQKLVAWCRRSLPDALKIETRVLKAIVKDHVNQTGEQPDGTNLTGGGQRFYIK